MVPKTIKNEPQEALWTAAPKPSHIIITQNAKCWDSYSTAAPYVYFQEKVTCRAIRQMDEGPTLLKKKKKKSVTML